MTTPMMANMPTPDLRHPTTANGYHHVPAQPSTPQTSAAPAFPAPPAPQTPTTRRPPTRRRQWSDLHGTAVLGPLFYLGVLIVAATGSSQAAVHWLGWELWLTVPAVLLAEVGGVYLSAMADEQRRDGEHAFAARILSTAVALGAVALNWFGHRERMIQAGFFAGMSALGYAVWLIQAGRRRRQRLREEGKLADTPPSYGLIQWLQQPLKTARARSLAKDTPGMGRVESLEAVRLQGALADFIRQEIIHSNAGPDGTPVDGEKVEALLAIYDPVSMARELRARVQWDEFADALAARIDPRRVLAKPSMPRSPTPPLPRPAAARARSRQVTTTPSRRSSAETLAEYDQLKAADEAAGVRRTEQEYAVLLTISPRRLRDVVNNRP